MCSAVVPRLSAMSASLCALLAPPLAAACASMRFAMVSRSCAADASPSPRRGLNASTQCNGVWKFRSRMSQRASCSSSKLMAARSPCRRGRQGRLAVCIKLCF